MLYPLSDTLESQLVFTAHSSESANAQVFVWKQLLIFPNKGQRAAQAALLILSVNLCSLSSPFKAKPRFPVVCGIPSYLMMLSCLSVPVSAQGTTCPIEIRVSRGCQSVSFYIDVRCLHRLKGLAFNENESFSSR